MKLTLRTENSFNGNLSNIKNTCMFTCPTIFQIPKLKLKRDCRHLFFVQVFSFDLPAFNIFYKIKVLVYYVISVENYIFLLSAKVTAHASLRAKNLLLHG